MKKIQLSSVILLTLVGCQKVEDSNNESKLMSFVAGIEVPTEDLETRTVLGGVTSDANRSVLWEYNDQICVANGTSYAKFTNQTEGTSDLAVFEGSLAQGTNYYAAYPYDMVTGYSSTGFTIELPAIQEYYREGISSDSFPMVAQCQGGTFCFRNLCGIFVLQLTGNKTISSITFSGKDASGKDISVAGKGTVSMDYLETPSLRMEDSTISSVILNCSEGVRLSQSQPTTFHIVLPVGTYNTISVTIKATDGTIMTFESKKALEIKRSNRITTAILTYPQIIHQDLNESGETANCYIVSKAGDYKFKTVKGNNTSVGIVSTVDVLWESYGTGTIPTVGDLIKNVSYSDGYIQFSTNDTFNEGNAVIAAKNSSGEILWSWHIWLTDHPKRQVYYNNAGTMMDRNLGATSATSGDVGAIGLMYQWGRKDPFLGSSSISSNTIAESTITWPVAVKSNSSNGTIAYATANPTTFIAYGNSSYDWYYTELSSTDNTRWTGSGTDKSIYDPCPAGWRVPDGGANGVWSTAVGPISGFPVYPYDSTNEGINFFGIFGDTSTIWYPALGNLDGYCGLLLNVGTCGFYWSATPDGKNAFILDLFNSGHVNSLRSHSRAAGCPVRCIQDGSL